MDLTRVVPTPEAVRAGGSVRLVHPLRLRDVARIEAFVRSRVPCPLDVALDEIAAKGLRGRARQRRLAEAYEACEAWPPRFGDPAADAVLDTADGIVFLLALIADRSGWTRGDLEDLLGSIEPGDLARIRAAAFQADPIDRLTDLMGLRDPDPEPDAAPSEPANWGESFARAAELTGWTFDQIADLTLPQWRALRTGGKVDRSATIPPGMSAAEAGERQRRKFWGEDLEP